MSQIKTIRAVVLLIKADGRHKWIPCLTAEDGHRMFEQAVGDEKMLLTRDEGEKVYWDCVAITSKN